MANKKNKPLFGGFDRLQSFPLDSSSVFETWGELEEYRLHSKIAYDGQLVVCLDNTYDHYGAYILQEKGGSTSYLHPYKLYGTEEFTKEVGELKAKLDALKNDFDTLTAEDIARLNSDMNRVNAWLNSIKDDNDEVIFATKESLESVNSDLNRRIDELLGEEFTAKLENLNEYKPTINTLWSFVQEYGPMLQNAISLHEERINENASRLNLQEIQVDSLLHRLLGIQERIANAEEKLAKLREHENKLIAHEQSLEDIKSELKSVEHFAEYTFTSASEIGGVEYTPNMVIKEIEIVIDETGENVVGGIFNDDTKMYIDFPSTNNPQNSIETVVSTGEIFISEGIKIVLDVDFHPSFNGHLRFCLEHSEGLSGHAYVKYYEKFVPQIPKYSVTVAPLSNISVYGAGLYEENDQVTITLVPDIGYVLKANDQIGAQAIVGGVTRYLQEHNGAYTLTFTMLNRNLNNIYVNELFAVDVPNSRFYPGVLDTANADEYYGKLSGNGNVFEWLPVYIDENGIANPYPAIVDNPITINLVGGETVIPLTTYYLNNAHVITSNIHNEDEEWSGSTALAYSSIITEAEYLKLNSTEEVVEEEPNGGE